MISMDGMLHSAVYSKEPGPRVPPWGKVSCPSRAICKSDLSKLAERLAFWVDCFEVAEQNQVAVVGRPPWKWQESVPQRLKGAAIAQSCCALSLFAQIMLDYRRLPLRNGRVRARSFSMMDNAKATRFN
jgi:hypothetical protein